MNSSAMILPASEEHRLAVLFSYDIMDTLDEQAYDDLTRLAAYICDTPFFRYFVTGQSTTVVQITLWA